jgi:hypothetical protein
MFKFIYLILLFFNPLNGKPLFFFNIIDKEITLNNNYKDTLYIKDYRYYLIENSLIKYLKPSDIVFLVDCKAIINNSKKKQFVNIENKKNIITFQNIEFNENIYNFFATKVYKVFHERGISWSEKEKDLLSRKKIDYYDLIIKKYGTKFKLMDKIKIIKKIYVTSKIHNIKIFLEILKIIYYNNYKHVVHMSDNEITVVLSNHKNKKDLKILLSKEKYYLNICVE